MLICTLVAVNQLGFGTIVPVIALYARSFDVSQSAIGLAIAAYGLARFLVAVPAGHLAASLRLSPNALTFHLDRLRDAGLVTVRREGRSMLYAAQFEAMNKLISYLTDQCCQGRPELCRPGTGKVRRRAFASS